MKNGFKVNEEVRIVEDYSKTAKKLSQYEIKHMSIKREGKE